MKDTAYAYSVSSVRVRETSLLGRAQIDALIAADGERSALRLLEDYGYSEISEDAESVLARRSAELTSYLLDISPDSTLLSFLFVKNDYHNLKAAMKCNVSGIDPAPFLMPPANVPHEVILRAVSERGFDLLPPYMRDTAERAWDAIVTEMNGQLCEVILDLGAVRASVQIAEDSGESFCIGLAHLRCRHTAIMVAYRSAVAGKNRDFLSYAIPEGERFLKDKLITAALSGPEDVLAVAAEYGITSEGEMDADLLCASFGAAEREYIARAAFVSMGAAPLVSYYLKCEAELSVIRVLLSCKRCGFSEAETRRRIETVL